MQCCGSRSINSEIWILFRMLTIHQRFREITTKSTTQLITKMSRRDPDPAGSVINWSSGSGSVIHDFRSADPDRKEIFTDPQHRIYESMIFFLPFLRKCLPRFELESKAKKTYILTLYNVCNRFWSSLVTLNPWKSASPSSTTAPDLSLTSSFWNFFPLFAFLTLTNFPVSGLLPTAFSWLLLPTALSCPVLPTAVSSLGGRSPAAGFFFFFLPVPAPFRSTFIVYSS